jgi:CDP-diacylglycerol--serine O-phosphatidyltransferase
MISDGRPAQLRRVSLADVMTIANGLCGFVALLILLDRSPSSESWGSSLLDGRLGIVLALIVCGLTLDALDGVVARRRGSSGLGPHLDLMCDAITFGVLPALLLIQSPAAEGAVGTVLALLVGGLYFTAAVVRLAVFADAPDHQSGFTGLPTPPAAVVALALLLLAPGAPAALAGFALIAFLMVSPYRWPHPEPFKFAVLALLGSSAVGLAFTGWISAALVASLAGGCALLVSPLGAAALTALQRARGAAPGIAPPAGAPRR